MNIISEIRDYVKAKVESVDNDLDFDGFVFDTEKVGMTATDCTYKLVIGETTPTLLDSSYQADIDTQVWIYKASGNNQVEDFDDTYCKALEIASLIIDQRSIDQLNFIKSISNTAITPEPVVTNDNLFRYRIQFTTNVYYKLD